MAPGTGVPPCAAPTAALAPALYLPITALAIGLAVTGQPLFWVGALFFVAVLTYTAVTTPRVLRNTTAVLAELDQRDTALLPRGGGASFSAV